MQSPQARLSAMAIEDLLEGRSTCTARSAPDSPRCAPRATRSRIRVRRSLQVPPGAARAGPRWRAPPPRAVWAGPPAALVLCARSSGEGRSEHPRCRLSINLRWWPLAS
ncbi:hypothetical protein QJS66_22850 [Kocuria rhizophila]|nr:hypothetical protein QJS66_22850 [Kocuria rhizophila]